MLFWLGLMELKYELEYVRVAIKNNEILRPLE